LSIQSALVIGSQERRSATNDGVSWDQERLSAREEGECYDVADGQDDEQERGGEALGSFDHDFLDRQGDLVSPTVDTDIEKGSVYCQSCDLENTRPENSIELTRQLNLRSRTPQPKEYD
jgi:hypothetical protein